jgi:hypothetical protein
MARSGESFCPVCGAHDDQYTQVTHRQFTHTVDNPALLYLELQHYVLFDLGHKLFCQRRIGSVFDAADAAPVVLIAHGAPKDH